MRKTILALLVAAVAALGLLATPAGAVTASPSVHLKPATSNGYWFKSFSCTSDGSYISFYINYYVDGVGNSGTNYLDVSSYGWSSSPAAKFNRLSLYIDTNGDGTHDQQIIAVGGSDSTKDDVASSYNSPEVGPFLYTGGWNDNTPGELQFKAYGGVGSQNGSCTSQHLP
jgi:hypothetical protein